MPLPLAFGLIAHQYFEVRRHQPGTPAFETKSSPITLVFPFCLGVAPRRFQALPVAQHRPSIMGSMDLANVRPVICTGDEADAAILAQAAKEISDVHGIRASLLQSSLCRSGIAARSVASASQRRGHCKQKPTRSHPHQLPQYLQVSARNPNGSGMSSINLQLHALARMAASTTRLRLPVHEQFRRHGLQACNVVREYGRQRKTAPARHRLSAQWLASAAGTPEQPGQVLCNCCNANFFPTASKASSVRNASTLGCSTLLRNDQASASATSRVLGNNSSAFPSSACTRLTLSK